jgi:hypothetical protein
VLDEVEKRVLLGSGVLDEAEMLVLYSVVLAVLGAFWGLSLRRSLTRLGASAPDD